jgi:hypothetical protein
LSDIRGLYLKNRLSAAEIEALEALGVIFDSMQVSSMLCLAIALARRERVVCVCARACERECALVCVRWHVYIARS